MDMDYNYDVNAKSAALDTTMSFPWNESLNSSIDHYYTHLESMMSNASPSSNDAFALGKLGGFSTSSASFPIESPNYLPDNNNIDVSNSGCLKRGILGNAVSNPLNKQDGSSWHVEIDTQSQMVKTKSTGNNRRIILNSENTTNEEVCSSVSELVLPSGETKPRRTSVNPRKRTAGSRRKSKDNESNSNKGNEGEEDEDSKRAKKTETGKTEHKATLNEANFGSHEKRRVDDDQKPLKDYIHVRARRGQATDPHSLAERVRREKISERMKLLQDLVPGCNKVTGKAPMLDEIINYVQSLQRQVEFLSMKLASVNPEMDFNISDILSKDVFQENRTLRQPLDTSSAAAFYHHQQTNVQLNNNDDGNVNVSVDPIGIQFPPVNGSFINEFPAFGEDDLQSIFQMGLLVQNPVNFHVSDHQTASVKIERGSSP